MTSGKWYWECLSTSAYNFCGAVADPTINSMLTSTGLLNRATAWAYRNDSKKQNGTTGAETWGNTFASGDIIGTALDMDNEKIWWSKNGVWQESGDPAAGTNPAYSGVFASQGVTNGLVTGHGQYSGTVSQTLNMGQDSSFAGTKTAQGNQDSNSIGDFYYEPPTGFLALCTNNLPDPEIALPEEQFNTVLYTGNGVGSRSITGVGFQPDYVWLKQTNNPTAYGHQVFDSIRGGTNYLVPNTNAAENDGTPSYGDQTLLTFESDGFTIGTSDTINEDGYQVASWNWKAGGSGAANSVGTITSTVSANTTAGFSICKYTGNGTADATFGHGLSTSPDLVVIKNIDQADDWMVWSPTFGSSGGNCTYLMSWNGDGGLGNWCSDTIRLNGTTKVQIASGSSNWDWVNKTGENYICYCWNNVEAFSKRGTYQGNAAFDGPFIYTGFRPAYLWTKGQGTSQHWHQFDNKQYPYNPTSNTTTTGIVLEEAANTGGGGGEGMGAIDILSNGFKLRANNGNGNDSSTTFTYLAFAAAPFKYSNAR
jgi:hypothetical protein